MSDTEPMEIGTEDVMVVGSADLTGPNILLRCDRPRCEYVVYGSDSEENQAKARDLMEGHLRQHDDPEGWKAEQNQEPVDPEDEG